MSGMKIFIAAACVSIVAVSLSVSTAQADSSYYIYFGSSRQQQRHECFAHRARTCYCPRCDYGRGHGVTVITPGRGIGGVSISDRRYLSTSGATVIFRSGDVRVYPYASYEYRYYQYGGLGYGVLSSSSAGFHGSMGGFGVTTYCPVQESQTRSRSRLDDIRRDAHERARGRR